MVPIDFLTEAKWGPKIWQKVSYDRQDSNELRYNEDPQISIVVVGQPFSLLLRTLFGEEPPLKMFERSPKWSTIQNLMEGSSLMLGLCVDKSEV